MNEDLAGIGFEQEAEKAKQSERTNTWYHEAVDILTDYRIDDLRAQEANYLMQFVRSRANEFFNIEAKYDRLLMDGKEIDANNLKANELVRNPAQEGVYDWFEFYLLDGVDIDAVKAFMPIRSVDPKVGGVIHHDSESNVESSLEGQIEARRKIENLRDQGEEFDIHRQQPDMDDKFLQFIQIKRQKKLGMEENGN